MKVKAQEENQAGAAWEGQGRSCISLCEVNEIPTSDISFQREKLGVRCLEEEGERKWLLEGEDRLD